MYLALNEVSGAERSNPYNPTLKFPFPLELPRVYLSIRKYAGRINMIKFNVHLRICMLKFYKLRGPSMLAGRPDLVSAL